MMHVMVDAVNICLRSLRSLVVVCIATDLVSAMLVITVNGEKFAGLNFQVFCGFQEHCKRFSVNIIQASYNGVVLVL